MLLLFSCPVVPNSLQPHGLQHARPPCPSPSPGVCPSSCSLHQWCRPAISSSDALFSFFPQSFPASGTFLMSRLFASDDQNSGASASVLPVNIQGWSPLRLTGFISLLSKGLSGVFSSTTDGRHQFFGIPSSLLYITIIYSSTIYYNFLSRLIKFLVGVSIPNSQKLIEWIYREIGVYNSSEKHCEPIQHN